MKAQVAGWTLFALLVAIGLGIAKFGTGYFAQSLFTTALFVLLATGWNVISGFTGHVSFGQVSFFGLGAYIAALAMLNLDVPWYAAAAIAGAAATIFALPLGSIMLRLEGIFFALGMFGLARILQIIASSLEITGGPMGTTVPVADSPQQSASAMLLVAAAAILATHWLTRSRLGLRLMAVRDDSTAAQAAGVHTAGAKVAAFCISACIAAVGGALYVWNVGYLDPSSAFAGTIELQTVLMVLAGGIGTVWGPVVGGVLISLVGTALWAKFPMEQQIVLGMLTMFIAVVMPGGILAALNRRGWIRRRPIWAPPAMRRSAQPRTDTAPRANCDRRTNSVLRCEELTVNFGGVMAVDGVSLEVHAGETLAIIGPNGAGKTTLFNLISAFQQPTSGSIYFEGEPLIGLKPHAQALRGVARTFQTSRLFPSLTLWETVLLAASSREPSRARAMEQTARILDEVGLLDQWADLPDALPPGRQRLLEIARALALRPRVLLLDEAMAGMTVEEIERVHQVLLAAAAGGCAIIAIEHVLPAIASIATRAHVLDFGRTIAEGKPGDVLRDPVVIEAYMGVEQEEPIDARA